MVPPGRWFTHSFLLALKFLSGYVHRSTLPQSRIRSTAPSEREPGTPHPGSLSEGAGSPQGLTEGVSSDGCSMPTIYIPAHMNSEIFERLRSSGYTPSVSHSLDSSLREGAGVGCVPFIGVLAKIRGCGRFSSPLRDSGCFSFHHSMGVGVAEMGGRW